MKSRIVVAQLAVVMGVLSACGSNDTETSAGTTVSDDSPFSIAAVLEAAVEPTYHLRNELNPRARTLVEDNILQNPELAPLVVAFEGIDVRHVENARAPAATVFVFRLDDELSPEHREGFLHGIAGQLDGSGDKMMFGRHEGTVYTAKGATVVVFMAGDGAVLMFGVERERVLGVAAAAASGLP